MMLNPRTPVIIGVSQLNQKTNDLHEALGPIELFSQAVRAAAIDTQGAVDPLSKIDALRVVPFLSARFRNPALAIANYLGITARQYDVGPMGGNTPQMMVNAACREIASGEIDLVVIAGGESMRTRRKARKQGIETSDLGWVTEPDDAPAPDHVGAEFKMSHPYEIGLGIYMPVQLYPMFEQSLRVAAGETIEEHQIKISELWEGFAAIAATNPNAAIRNAPTAEEIRTAGPSNRMIGFPYPKMMNSNMDVDQAAATILCSADMAHSLGVPADRWVFPWVGTDAHDTPFISNRRDFAESDAIRTAGRRALELAGLTIDEVSHFDLYSCFPSAVQLGMKALGIGAGRQLTVTGGLPFAGGPFNSYVMHAINEMVGVIRSASDGKPGLVWGNGGCVTKHSFGIYSSNPSPSGGYQYDNPQAPIDAMPTRNLAENFEGAATVETYTVMHDRDGNPELFIAACRTPNDDRAWGISRAADLAQHAVTHDLMGHACQLAADGTINIG